MCNADFRVGQWHVCPGEGRLRRNGDVRRLQPKVMAVLCRLAQARGEMVPREQLLTDVWKGRAMSDEPLHRCIAELRSAFSDCRQPFIETLPRRGYRLVPPVIADDRFRGRAGWLSVAAAALLLGLTGTLTMQQVFSRPASQARVLVMPLANHSGADYQLLADGLTDELIVAITQRLDLPVMSRSTTFSLKDSNAKPADLREQLGVDLLVEGTIRLVDAQLRITIRLVDAVNERHLMTKEFEQPAEIAAELLQDIAREIAHQIGRASTAPDILASSSPLKFPVYQQLLEAKQLLRRRNESDVRKAVAQLESVLAAVPDHADAHAHMAAAYYALRNIDERLPLYDSQIDAHLARTLSLDARHPLALALQAVLIQQDDPLRAMQLLETVVTNDPAQLDASRWYVQLLYRAGYLEEAVQYMNAIHVRDPLSATTLGWLADLERSLGNRDSYERLIRRADVMGWDPSDTVQFYEAIRRRDEHAAARHLVSRWSHSARVTEAELRQIVAGIFHARERATAVALVQDMLARPRPITRFWAFVWLELLGERDAAIDLVLADPQPRDIRILYSVWSPEHGALRRHPRFGELVRHFKLDTVWRARGPNRFCALVAQDYVCH